MTPAISCAPRLPAYDVIIGDLFHPDLAGSGSLLSVEQFERVRARLARGGLFVQWLALNQFDRNTLAIVLRSFRQVFPEAQMFLDGLHLALVGPRDQWRGAPALIAHLDALEPGSVPRSTPWRVPTNGWDAIGGRSRRVQAPPSMNGRRSSNFCCRACTMGAAPTWHRCCNRCWRSGRASNEQAELLRLSRAAARGFQEGLHRHRTARAQRAGKLAGLDARGRSSARTCLRGRSARPLDRLRGSPTGCSRISTAASERGMSREQLLQKILIINPWSVEAWRALWQLQIANGDPAAAASRARILELSPLDRAVGTTRN